MRRARTHRILIEPVDDPLAWCVPDPSAGSPTPMRAVVYFDPQRFAAGDYPALWVSLWHQFETGIPAPEYLGWWIAWTLSPRIDAQRLTQRLNAGEADPYLAQIAGGFSRVWDGHNWRGRLTGEAASAVEGLRQWLDACAMLDELAGLYDAADWFPPGEPLPVTASTTDDELAAIAGEIEAEARAVSGAVLVGTAAYLREARDRLRQEARDAAW